MQFDLIHSVVIDNSHDSAVKSTLEVPVLAHWSLWQGPLDAGVHELMMLFNALFAPLHTVLVPGSGEPQYIPGHAGEPDRIEFAHGYFASALHEIAHWCIAGSARRRLVDFGYWYQPDGRTAEQQRVFEQVEVKPQALEWIFTVASGRAFRISQDNLAGDAVDTDAFEHAVQQEVLRRLAEGLPARAAQWTAALIKRFSPGLVLHPGLFERATLAIGAGSAQHFSVPGDSQ